VTLDVRQIFIQRAKEYKQPCKTNDEKPMETNPKFNQKAQEKKTKIIKNTQKSTKSTPRKASGHCRGSRWGKMAQKEVGNRILGVPWDPLGDPKIVKKSKK